ncbi:hypothetical protein FQR65_LT17124 [Abscondita terminalis]|nr:hypothetical protein FQR65_LT17124 [Abscondita terminalis]
MLYCWRNMEAPKWRIYAKADAMVELFANRSWCLGAIQGAVRGGVGGAVAASVGKALADLRKENHLS